MAFLWGNKLIFFPYKIITSKTQLDIHVQKNELDPYLIPYI